ncbi:hypothetical protein C2845_PM09G01060 [Panicum miliaceum]|uniref:DUF4220 domain-containing protein n=1 Tax=Panicum miliaceum TaxID=4540 RepID=A0A3L6RXA4_PANMI|nr:hypothetical protein C2845_PM09G01060 [Panicum miliaceum]
MAPLLPEKNSSVPNLPSSYWDRIEQPTTLCPAAVIPYVLNLTSSYRDRIDEPTMVSASLFTFVLAGIFFSLNLLSGVSSDNVSAILHPRIRIFLSSALLVFLPVMSYLFSEAKNAGYYYPTSSGADASSEASMAADLSLRAGLILAWMLIVELLRKKLDEIPMKGYSSTIQRAGRVAWLGSLVFFNIKSAGRKAVFSILWILRATKVVQRIAFTEIGKRSYSHGAKNAWLLTSCMAHQMAAGDHGVGQAAGGNELLKRCNYIVMVEEKLMHKVTFDGYKLNRITPNDGIITVGKVWELVERDQQRFASMDQNQRLRGLCLSFVLFKLLRRRLELQPAMTDEETRDCRDLILNGLYNNNNNCESMAAGALVFQVMNDEVNFLCEYYHSVVPVVLASPSFLLVNYFLLHIVVFGLCFMAVVFCGNGDVTYAFKSISSDNYTLHSGIAQVAVCLLSRATHSPSAFFAIVDLSITVFLFAIFFYEEMWEFAVFVLSNWFLVSLICNYVAKTHCPITFTTRVILRSILWLRSKMTTTDIRFKQLCVLNLRRPPLILRLLPATLFLSVEKASVPSNLKHSVMEYLTEHVRGAANFTPLTNGKSALRRNNLLDQLSCACSSNSLAEVILTWHVATSLLEVKCPTTQGTTEEAAALSGLANRLSKYCAYLLAFHPEILPDNLETAELVLEEMNEELKVRLGCWVYYFSWRHTRIEKIMETRAAAGWMQNKVVQNGATLAGMMLQIMDDDDETSSSNGLEALVWKVLADVWTELIIYIAASSDQERVKGHENILEQGGEFITLLWALAMHTGISRPNTNATTTTTCLPEA